MPLIEILEVLYKLPPYPAPPRARRGVHKQWVLSIDSHNQLVFTFFRTEARACSDPTTPARDGRWESSLVLGYWGNTMRGGALRNEERWKRRRTPTQDPSTS